MLKKSIVIDTEPIRKVLQEKRKIITYPLNTNSKVNEIFSQLFRVVCIVKAICPLRK
jgi:hypothetical protein